MHLGPIFPFSRGSFMLDFVAAAMVVVVPLLLTSVYAIRYRRRVALHRRLQLGLASVLALTVLLFELDMRLNGWRTQAAASPYFATLLFPVLYVHLFFSVSTTLLWITTVVTALRRPPHVAGSDGATQRHRRLGRLTTAFTLTTAVTGCSFYWMAFVAT